MDDPSKWSPFGVPGAGDWANFGVGGTYSVTFPGTVPQTGMISAGSGLVTFSPTSPHTTGGFYVGSFGVTNSLTQNGGVFFADYMQCGAASGVTTLTLTNRAQFQSRGVNNPNGSGLGDHLGYAGSSYVYVQSGARYYSNMLDAGHWPLELGSTSGSSVAMAVFGLATLPTAFSGLVTTGGGEMIVGVAGAATVQAYNGGFIDASGNVTMARDASSFGFITVGPTSIGTPFFRAQQNLWIGRNAGGSAGHAEVTVKSGAWASAGGSCEIGDPDNDAQSVLRVQEGGRFYADGGLKVWPTSGKGIDLQGGLLHVRGGAFSWPAGKYLYLSSGTGNPELRITNGIMNTGPSVPAFNSQLFVARSGNGKLRIARPGTVFQVGAGATIVADSVDGVGTVEVDSVAIFSSVGPVNIGVRGSGYWTVSGASLADVGTAAVALTNTAYAYVYINQPSSTLRVHDNFWIGGGFGGPGGNGDVGVDSSAAIEVYQTNWPTPAYMTIYPPGTIGARYKGRIWVAGTISNAGQFIVADGDVEAENMLQPTTGLLRGWGRLTTMLQTSGQVDIFDDQDPCGGLHVTGTFQQFSPGHLVMDLKNFGGTECDTLFVSGSATLAGTLDLRTTPNSTFNPGDVFTIIRCGSRTGTFENVTWNGVPLTTEAAISYQPEYVSVVIGGQASGVGVDPGIGASLPSEIRLSPAGVGPRLGFALDLPQDGTVQVKVFDVTGREVATFFDGSLSAGRHDLAEPAWLDLPSGNYFARAVVRANGRAVVKVARGVVVR